MFNPITASEQIKDEFISYIMTLFHISDQEYAAQFAAALREEGAVSKGPYLDISDVYETGMSLDELIEQGEASPAFRTLEGNIADGDKELQIQRGLYLHQEKALRKTNQGRNLIVTTGTGSGKTECFIIPIINHLLREAKNGTLGSGVRAILIYPMNALANDQMKRLRALLKEYPEITFGVYNSSTKQHLDDAIDEYGKVYKTPDGIPMKPMKNEIICRDQMQKEPPHILVTNYAMLEYMMLRPKDDRVFSGAQLRFIVLDEAHIYRGATGMETSLLLKRLKARISDPANVLHILTSATLGGKEADDDIVRFAGTLCNAEFHRDDIIRSKCITPLYEEDAVDMPASLFDELANPEKPLNEIVSDYGISIPAGQSDSEFLYDLCRRSSAYRVLRQVVNHPMTVAQIAEKMASVCSFTGQDVANLISVAVQAEKNKTPLLKARYHMFAKALEGAYLVLGKNKRFTLNRNRSMFIDGEEYKLFECAVCDDCGRIAVWGKNVSGKLEFANGSDDPDVECFLIKESYEKNLDFSDDDGDAEIGRDDYRICPKCGAIIHESQKDHPECSCGVEYISVVKAPRGEKRDEHKCTSCNYGKLISFYIGYDAATAVLGTSLFEKLPESEKKLKRATVDPALKKNLFARAAHAAQVEVVRKKRQFLSFSDSRGEAAYFATKMTSSYKEFLRRRGIWHVIDKHRADMTQSPWEIETFVKELSAYFDANRTFAEPGDSDSKNLSIVSERNAWIAVMNEMVNARRSTSLASLGILMFNYKGNSEEIMAGVAEAYNRRTDDVLALFNLLVMDIVYQGAIEGGCALSDDEREYIYYSIVPKRMILCKDQAKHKKKTHVTGWKAGMRKNGSLIHNNRLRRVMEVLNLSEEGANQLLEEYWNGILRAGTDETALKGTAEQGYYLSTRGFTIRAGMQLPLYICNTCGKTSMINCAGMCPTVKCTGHLRLIDHETILQNNHYANLYRSAQMQPLHIKEHTAQLGREEQQKYQEMFVNKDINALSCSTTFEMGVDVGDLETVYLRNMPPSPANYVQRAGRAGRGRHAAAFSLTYSKLSSHDFSYYKNPEHMITGKIGVPLFAVRNEKVILRHIFAVALSEFFAKHEDVYNSNDADVLLNGNGWELLGAWLNSKPESLRNTLRLSIPADMHDAMGINDFAWTDRLIGKDGVLAVAVSDFRETVRYYQEERERLRAEELLQQAALIDNKLCAYRRSKSDKRGRNELIEFLVRNNVLPKYGFPVDTVELHQSANAAAGKKLQMVRDLQLAISEYAPNAQVIADGKLFTSRYIRKLPQSTGQDWESVYIAECGNPTCRTWNHRTVKPEGSGCECVSCKEEIAAVRWKQAIEPRKGFIADSYVKNEPTRKPEKSYRSDDYYIGDAQRQIMQQLSFYTAENASLQMETSINDSLMVVCNDDFFVCNYCGYAESTSENESDTSFSIYQKTMERKHDTPWGKKCDVRLEKYKLCHVFKSDVVRLTFSVLQASSQSVMLSVMYSLLEAMSKVLDIERNDIKGCLHKVVVDGKLLYSIVLYDAVAGGAGHVRRLATESGDVFMRVIEKALEITDGCTCSPSCYNCLRNYYNQRIHDQLDRRQAVQFLRIWATGIYPAAQKKDSTGMNAPCQLNFEDGYGMNLRDSSWRMIWNNGLSAAESAAELELLDRLQKSEGDFSGREKPYYDGSFVTTDEYFCDLIWPESRVMLFTGENRDGYESALNSEWTCFAAWDPSLTPMDILQALKEV